MTKGPNNTLVVKFKGVNMGAVGRSAMDGMGRWRMGGMVPAAA